MFKWFRVSLILLAVVLISVWAVLRVTERAGADLTELVFSASISQGCYDDGASGSVMGVGRHVLGAAGRAV